MRISTRGRYCTRMMLELALEYGKGPIFLKEIAEKQEVSMKYLSQLLLPLKVAGLITGTKGAHGGYMLAKPPKDIKLSDIITAVEGSLNPAECVDNPSDNFAWGLFAARGKKLPLPEEFTKEDFHSKLYGVRAGGSTDCIALYKEAREEGSEVDVYITDQGHNVGTINKRISDYHSQNPSVPMPKAAVIIDFSGRRNAMYTKNLEDGLKKAGIPVATMPPEALKESALISQSVAAAVKGEMAIIDAILDTPLPKLPKWWDTVKK